MNKRMKSKKGKRKRQKEFRKALRGETPDEQLDRQCCERRALTREVQPIPGHKVEQNKMAYNRKPKYKEGY